MPVVFATAWKCPPLYCALRPNWTNDPLVFQWECRFEQLIGGKWWNMQLSIWFIWKFSHKIVELSLHLNGW
jgi:hypothetical protein